VSGHVAQYHTIHLPSNQIKYQNIFRLKSLKNQTIQALLLAKRLMQYQKKSSGVATYGALEHVPPLEFRKLLCILQLLPG